MKADPLLAHTAPLAAADALVRACAAPTLPDARSPGAGDASAFEAGAKPLPLAAQRSLLGIQYLRGIAALMVVYHHGTAHIKSVAWSGFGATGVDIFFVISGFIMAYTCSREPVRGASRAFDSADFLLKRLIRILPLYWVALVIAWRVDLFHGLVSLDLLKDYAFVPRFFAPGDPRVWPKLIPGWTINCEMFFYLLFALAILLSPRRLALVLMFLIGLSLVGTLVTVHGPAAELYTWTLFLEFGFGIVLFLAHRRSTRCAPTALWVGVALLGFGALAYASRADAYEWTADRFLMYGVPSLLIVWAGLQVRQSFVLPLMKLLGDASYSIYLFHYTVGLPLALHVQAALGLTPTHWMRITLMLVIDIVCSAAVGIAIHWFVEKPLLKWLRGLNERFVLKERPA